MVAPADVAGQLFLLFSEPAPTLLMGLWAGGGVRSLGMVGKGQERGSYSYSPAEGRGLLCPGSSLSLWNSSPLRGVG